MRHHLCNSFVAADYWWLVWIICFFKDANKNNTIHKANHNYNQRYARSTYNQLHDNYEKLISMHILLAQYKFPCYYYIFYIFFVLYYRRFPYSFCRSSLLTSSICSIVTFVIVSHLVHFIFAMISTRLLRPLSSSVRPPIELL